MYCNPEYIVADIYSDLANSKRNRVASSLRKVSGIYRWNDTWPKQCQLGTTQQRLVHALHSGSGSNCHVSITYCAARPALGKQVFRTVRPRQKIHRPKYGADGTSTLI